MILIVKVVPGSSVDVVSGWLGDSLKIKVRTPPTDGRANASVIRLLADLLSISRSQIVIQHGRTSAHKRLEISGLDNDQIWSCLPRKAHA